MLRTLFLSLLFITSLFGEKSQSFSFMGVAASTETLDINLGESLQETGMTLRYGQQSLDWRTTFSLNYTPSSYVGASVEIDKILLDDMFGTPKLRPYLGAVVGYMRFTDDHITESYDGIDGFYFGGNFGFIIYTKDNIDIDISYHYYSVQNLDFLDDIHGATLAVHYFF